MSKLEKTVSDLILKDIVGDIDWYGETYHDSNSLDNMEASYELALSLIDGIYKNATLARNAVETHSGARLNKRAKEMLEYIEEICKEVKRDA